MICETYGFAPNEIRAAKARWGRIRNDCTWESFDEFLQWMAKSEFQKGYHMGKLYETAPHGPENSIWIAKDSKYMTELMALSQIPAVGNALCDVCDSRETSDCDRRGCAQWREWFVKNWNKNICRRKETPVTRAWVYHHPDDIREGRA